MKNRINEISSDNKTGNDRPSYFSDPLSADEVGRLLHPVETIAKDTCQKWKSVFAEQASKTRCDS